MTHDESVAPPEYNYRDKAELEQRTHEPYFMSGESHGLSVFFRIHDDVFHTYSTYARGCEGLTDAYSLLDRTPYGPAGELRELAARVASEANLRVRIRGRPFHSQGHH